jgi:hypothetical protein
MKLYTEEQVMQLTQGAFTAGQNHNTFIFGEVCKNIRPIELPSDEEIYINANVNSENTEQHIGFIKGMQTIRELIEKNKL